MKRHARDSDMLDQMVKWAILLTKFNSPTIDATIEATNRLDELPRFVMQPDESLSRVAYERRNFITAGCLHWGQYKLLLSEIEFLSYARRLMGFDVLDKIDHVVYAGSANGAHIPVLADMFPMVSFHCWDPAKFSDGIVAYSQKHPERIKLFRTLFTAQSAEGYATKKILFISDVRQFSSGPKDDAKHKEFKDEDHRLQRQWVRVMKPMLTMLKFSPPYEAMQYEYMDGFVVTQAYAPVTSTESRLFIHITDPLVEVPERMYDTREYEEKFAYINRVLRMRDLDNRNPSSIVNKHTIVVDGKPMTFTVDVAKMRTHTPMSGYDQWRSTQILLEWALTEISTRAWTDMKATERKKYKPYDEADPSTFNVFYGDLIRGSSIDTMITAMNGIIEAMERVSKQSTGRHMIIGAINKEYE